MSFDVPVNTLNSSVVSQKRLFSQSLALITGLELRKSRAGLGVCTEEQGRRQPESSGDRGTEGHTGETRPKRPRAGSGALGEGQTGPLLGSVVSSRSGQRGGSSPGRRRVFLHPVYVARLPLLAVDTSVRAAYSLWGTNTWLIRCSSTL